MFPLLIEPLRKAYPHISLLLSEGLTRGLTELLITGEIDAILVSLPIMVQGTEHAEVFTEPFFLACPKGHVSSAINGLGWDDIATSERLVLGEGHCLPDQALEVCSTVDASRRLAMSIETIKYMVAAGEGCTLLPALSIGKSDLIVCRPMKVKQYSRRIVLAWRQSDLRRKEFLELAERMRTITTNELQMKFGKL